MPLLPFHMLHVTNPLIFHVVLELFGPWSFQHLFEPRLVRESLKLHYVLRFLACEVGLQGPASDFVPAICCFSGARYAEWGVI